MTATGVRALRGLSGILAGGLVALGVAVCVAQWLAGPSGRPGPGTAVVVGHVLAALVVVALQTVADRVRSPLGSLASGVILVITAGVLWFGWWA